MMAEKGRAQKIGKISFVVLCCTIVFTTLAYGTVHQPIIAAFYIIIAVIALLWAAESFFSGLFRFSRAPIQIPLLLLGLYAFVQVIPFGSVSDLASGLVVQRTISLEPFATSTTAIHISFLCVMFAAVLVYTDSEGRIRKLVTFLTVFGAAYAFFAIIQAVLSPEKIYGIYEPASATPFGSFVNRHNFAAIIEMTIAIPLAQVFSGAVEKEKRLLYWVAITLMATSLLLSGSRGGLVALLAGLFFLAILTIRQSGRPKALATLGLTGALILIALVGAIFVGGDTSLTRFTDAAASENISSSRNHIWSVTLKVISANFPLGAGLGAFPQAYTRFDTTGGSQRVDQAHNDYLQVLADAGIVGAVIGMAFLYMLFRVGSRNIRTPDRFRRSVAMGAFTGCVTILVHSLFDFVLHITAVSVMFLTLLGLLVASGRRFEDGGSDGRESKVTRKSEPVTDINRSSTLKRIDRREP